MTLLADQLLRDSFLRIDGAARSRVRTPDLNEGAWPCQLTALCAKGLQQLAGLRSLVMFVALTRQIFGEMCPGLGFEYRQSVTDISRRRIADVVRDAQLTYQPLTSYHCRLHITLRPRPDLGRRFMSKDVRNVIAEVGKAKWSRNQTRGPEPKREIAKPRDRRERGDQVL